MKTLQTALSASGGHFEVHAARQVNELNFVFNQGLFLTVTSSEVKSP
jgi:hypothetical protein